MFRGFVAALALTSAVIAQATFAADAPKTLRPDEQVQLQHNLALGTLLYEYDQSAWHVTDAALAAMPNAIKSQSRGYVTTPARNGFRTTFYGLDGTKYYPIYSAVWTGSKIEDERRFAGNDNLSAEELRLIEDRRVALAGAGELVMCSKARPNIIVVPDGSDPALTHVYVLTPQTSNGHFPAGGHHRIDVSGGKVVATRDFTKHCVDLEVPGGDKKPVGLIVTHLLDPVPTEIHVFTVFATRLPLFVGVPDGRLYGVEVRDGKAEARIVGSGN